MLPRLTTSKFVKYMLAAVGALAVLFALLSCGLVWLVTSQHAATRETVTFSIPGTEFSIEHSRLSPLLAFYEYDRDVSVIVKGQKSPRLPLSIDVSLFGYPVNCYLIETPQVTLLRLDDAVDEHLIDLTHQSVYRIIRARGDLYYGSFDSLNSGGFSGSRMANDDPFTLDVRINGAPAKPLAPILRDSSERYVGRIEGEPRKLRFVPAAESAEIKINTWRDR